MEPAQDPWTSGPDQVVPPSDAPQPPPAEQPAAQAYPSDASQPPSTDYPPMPGYPPAADYPDGYPPGGGYAAPPGYPYMSPPVASGNQFGLLSMIFGIVSIPFTLCCTLGLPLGVAGVVLGVLAVRTPNPMRPADRSQGIAGLACGGVAILLTVGRFGLMASTVVPDWLHH